MDLSSAIVWWDEWKLRILVLCSLIVHSSLLFAGYVRRSYVLRSLRVLVWIAYIGGDALAIYALATLFNRQKQQTMADGGGNYAIEVIWAPFLLIHLGGQLQISAYSLEDNELWKRHAITLVSQVTVALYVFCKWLSGETRLLESTVLLFIAGILKFSQKPWALRRASYGSMNSTYLSSQPRRPRWSWGRCIEMCTTQFSDIRAQYLEEKLEGGVIKKDTNFSLEDYVKEAVKHVKGGPKENEKAQGGKLKDLYKMFLDVSAPYSVRLHYLRSFLNSDKDKQHKRLQKAIGYQFLAIYTKVRSRFTCLGLGTFLVLPSMVIASVVLFAKSDKDGYDKSDIMVTYILFFGTVVVELGSFFIGVSCRRLFQCNLLSQKLTWQDMVCQHNIMSFCVRKKKPPTLMKLAAFSYLRDFINKHWYIRYQCVAKDISALVHHHAEYGWKEYISNPTTYRRFNNFRGDHTLWKHHLLDQDMKQTFNLPFDEYVLLWHLATDLCIHQTTNDDAWAASTSHCAISTCRRCTSEIISNYMIYLLFICPEMLIPGARQDLFILVCNGIEGMIKDPPLSPLDERSIAKGVFCCMGQEGDKHKRESTVIISDAYKLAKVLTGLNHTEMWEVIQGVWVEILCYSASRCRGYQHAKSLGVAGEFLTNVWLLWWFMGMQTLPDMMHNLGCPEELTAADSAAAACVPPVASSRWV